MKEKQDERLKPIDKFTDNPEDLMPLPFRFRKPKPEIPLEAPVSPLEAEIEASEAKDISTPEVVETDFEEIIKARKNAHQTMLRK